MKMDTPRWLNPRYPRSAPAAHRQFTAVSHWLARLLRRTPLGAQFRVLASQLQALDRLVAAVAEVRADAGLGQATTADLVSLLRGGDGDCEDGHSCAVRWAAGGAARGQGCLLIM